MRYAGLSVIILLSVAYIQEMHLIMETFNPEEIMFFLPVRRIACTFHENISLD